MKEIFLIFLRIVPFIIIIGAATTAIRKGKFTREELFLKSPDSKLTFICWVISFIGLIVVVEYSLFSFGLLEVVKLSGSFVPLLIRIIGVVLLAPVAEELLFRGIFLFKLNQWKINKHVAIFIQAVVFVLLHSFTYQNSTASNIGVIQSFVDAVLFGYAKYHTKSLYTPIVLHASGNAIALLEQFI